MSLLSVIVPCYNEEESVALFYSELMKNEEFFKERKLDVEILYIDDGSRDKTVAEVKKLREEDERVHLISFSRNFGSGPMPAVCDGFMKLQITFSIN